MPPNIETIDFSTDAKYLLQIATAVSTGSCSVSLGNLKPGPIHNARWLTTASRVLRLYIASKKSSKNLLALAKKKIIGIRRSFF